MFTKPEKPFMRTDKGTVKRRATATLYLEEIDKFYDERENFEAMDLASKIDVSSSEAISQTLRDVFEEILPCHVVIGLEDDLFNAGLDSLLAIQVTQCLRSAFERHGGEAEKKASLAPQFVYANATIQKLSMAFYGLLNRTANGLNTCNETQIRNIRNSELNMQPASPKNRGSVEKVL